jgi:hypothetical protein
MEIDRRSLICGGAVALAMPSSWAASGAAEFISAGRHADGNYIIALLDQAGRIIEEIPLAGRAHDIAWSPNAGVAVAFARQPGRFALAFSPSQANQPTLFTPPDDRCFFGHGVFTADGRLLYATENDLDSGAGRIGVYDATAAFARVGELSSGGVGPHEVLLLADDRTLAVANGGYETLPATGRQAIDIASMRPSLVFLDRLTGEVRVAHELPSALRPLSIRHLAAAPDGRVWFGGQWEGSADATPEIIGSAGMDYPVRLLTPKAPLGVSLKGYIGSVAISRDGATLAASAPRAGRSLFIDVASGVVVHELHLPDACGLASTDKGFTVSSGHGRVVGCQADGGEFSLAASLGVAFDNHLRWLRTLSAALAAPPTSARSERDGLST